MSEETTETPPGQVADSFTSVHDIIEQLEAEEASGTSAEEPAAADSDGGEAGTEAAGGASEDSASAPVQPEAQADGDGETSEAAQESEDTSGQGAAGADEIGATGGEPPAPAPAVEPAGDGRLASEILAERDHYRRQAEAAERLQAEQAERLKALEARPDLAELMRTDPIAAVEAAGLKWDEYLNRAIEDPKSNQAAALAERQKQTLEAQAEKVTQMEQKLLRMDELQLCRNLVQQNSERWSRLSSNIKADEAIHTEFYDEYSRTGVQPSLESIADRLETQLEEAALFEEFKRSRASGGKQAPPAPEKTEAAAEEKPIKKHVALSSSDASEASSEADDWESLKNQLGREPTDQEVIDYIANSLR